MYKISIESKIDGAITRTTFETDNVSIRDVFDGFIGQLVSHSFPIELVENEMYRRAEADTQKETTIISDMDYERTG